MKFARELCWQTLYQFNIKQMEMCTFLGLSVQTFRLVLALQRVVSITHATSHNHKSSVLLCCLTKMTVYPVNEISNLMVEASIVPQTVDEIFQRPQSPSNALHISHPPDQFHVVQIEASFRGWNLNGSIYSSETVKYKIVHNSPATRGVAVWTALCKNLYATSIFNWTCQTFSDWLKWSHWKRADVIKQQQWNVKN